MDKCKWIGHKWDKWELIPSLTYKGVPSSIREQIRKCKRCGKAEISYAT